MRLRTIAPIVKFRAELPAWMEPKGVAFIEIDARPAGEVNTAFMAARDEVVLAHKVSGTDHDLETVEGIRANRAFGAAWIGAIYDTCVIGWRTNLIDDATGNALATDRDTFLDLADVRIADVSKVFLDFQKAIIDAGAKVIADTEATTKN